MFRLMSTNLCKYNNIMKFIDIGANLTDPMFQGIYNSSVKHEADLKYVLDRAWTNGIDKIIITVGQLSETDEALKIAQQDDRLFITMGCHPTRCNEFEKCPDKYFTGLCDAIDRNPDKIIAIGECGLDYDRLHFCEKTIQQKYFERQLDLLDKYNLPLFLHCRNAFDDFTAIVMRHLEKVQKCGGVIHSFDGTIAQAQEFIKLGFYIGINGCSLKTMENLETVNQIPIDRLLIETDCPWCGVRPSHAGSKLIKTQFATVKKKEKWTKDTMIDGRCEPSNIIQVLEIIAAVREMNVEELAEQIYQNSIKLFFTK